MVPADSVLESLGCLGPTGAVLPCLPRVLPVPLGVWEGGPGLGNSPPVLLAGRSGQGLCAQAHWLSCVQGNRCVFNLCRGCCKKRAFKEMADCPGEGRPPPSAPPPTPAGRTVGSAPPEPHISPPPSLPGHGLLFKTKLEKSLAWKGAQPRLQDPQQAGPGEPGGLPEVLGGALA